MENSQEQVQPKNSLYKLAKKITETSNDKEKEKLFSKLGKTIKRIFRSDNTDEIETALSIAADNDEDEVISIILDDTEIEISNIDFIKNNEEYNSSMLILSCAMITPEGNVNIPSIGRFQSVIQKHLLEAKVITSADQFRLGAVRIANDTIDDLSMNDWWDIHRNIVTDLDTKENLEKLEFITNTDVDGGVTMFHFIPVIVTKEGEDDNALMGDILDSDKYDDLWTRIGKELSSEKIGFNLMAPNFISRGISEAQFTYQSSQLQLMFTEYGEFENIEMGYMRTSVEDTYIVFFIDNEGNTLVNFYIFETDGNENELINMLVNEVEEFPSQKLWHFDQEFDMDDLDNWYDEEKSTDLEALMKTAHAVDIRQYKQFIHGTATKYLH